MWLWVTMTWWRIQCYIDFVALVIFKMGVAFCNFTGLHQDVSAEMFALNLARFYVFTCVFAVLPICLLKIRFH